MRLIFWMIVAPVFLAGWLAFMLFRLLVWLAVAVAFSVRRSYR
jgi:hypothetical protein